MRSLADFDMYSTSKKHIQRTRMCVIASCHITNDEFYFFLKHFQTIISQIIEWMQSFELLAWKKNWGFFLFSWFFMFIAISK